MGIREHFKRLLYETPDDANAIEYLQSWWTWAKIRGITNRIDELLQKTGVPKFERVGVILENRPEHIAVLLKLLESKQTIVVLNPLKLAQKLLEDVKQLNIKVIIVGATLFQDKRLLSKIMMNTVIFELNHSGEIYSIGRKLHTNNITASDIAIEILTSGTTGIPKQIKLSYKEIENSLIASGQTPRNNQLLIDSVSLVSMPIFHISGLWGVLSALYTGRKIVLMPKFVLEPWVEAIERHKIRATFLVPAALHDLQSANIDPAKINSLKIITSGSTYCPTKLIDQILALYGIRVLMSYGATEFAGAVAGWNYELHREWWTLKSGSAGKAYPGIKLRITNEFGHELPIGQAGFLEVCPEGRISEENKCRWSRTSDLANIDDDGFLWILGRADNMIIRGGFKIQPEKIKNLLETHPWVNEAAIVGVPDVRLNTIPVAVIETNSNKYSKVNELVSLCHKELLPYEIPKHFLTIDKLPKTAVGKINHTELLTFINNNLRN
ncbi:long-chain fatty acid--CoA ligase [Xenorhabdus sp. SF857]|uniref:class I adenylate-forming enzyme family protein n=1 Tax=Xenorhabdus bakwenae TaxID=3026967 RepID=UPI0025582528|nr:long-chain fatty acid--CoA ligase [Xenorhabdus sp. SF857]WFQ80768.1 long-chain fatty acid--CoA ligase [Xenorhabdus sp. SF857]